MYEEPLCPMTAKTLLSELGGTGWGQEDWKLSLENMSGLKKLGLHDLIFCFFL